MNPVRKPRASIDMVVLHSYPLERSSSIWTGSGGRRSTADAGTGGANDHLVASAKCSKPRKRRLTVNSHDRYVLRFGSVNDANTTPLVRLPNALVNGDGAP